MYYEEAHNFLDGSFRCLRRFSHWVFDAVGIKHPVLVGISRLDIPFYRDSFGVHGSRLGFY